MKPLLHLLSPSGPRARLSILIFHRVLARPDPLCPEEFDAERFDAVCFWISRWFNVLPLQAAIRRLRSRTLPARALAITFDDGYADNHDIALPILHRHGLNATFFVATGFLDGGRMWNDSLIEAIRSTKHERLDVSSTGLPGVELLYTATLQERRAALDRLIAVSKYLEPAVRDAAVRQVVRVAGVRLPDDLMMRSAQLQELQRAGMGIGGHTETHPILARLDENAMEREIVRGRDTLQSLIQASVDLFAYPNGKPDEDYTDTTVAIVKRLGFEAAVSTAWGTSDAATDDFNLPRFTPWDRERWRFGLRMARNLSGIA